MTGTICSINVLILSWSVMDAHQGVKENVLDGEVRDEVQ